MKTKQILHEFIEITPTEIKKSDDVNKGLVMIDKQFREDFHQMVVARNISSHSALNRLMDEFNKKWKNLSNKIHQHFGMDILNPNGFIEVIIKSHSEELYKIYQTEKL